MKPSTAPAEWPGAVSAKFTDKLTGLPLRRKPIDAPFKYGAQEGLARNGFGRYFTDEDGLIPNQMKRFIPMPDSQTLVWRPGKRPLAEPGLSNIEKPEGLARVESFCAKVYTTSEKRHIRQLESKEEIQDRPWGKRTVYRENRLRASDQPAREIDITTEMRRKARVEDLLLQRNLIECYTLGRGQSGQSDNGVRVKKWVALVNGKDQNLGWCPHDLILTHTQIRREPRGGIFRSSPFIPACSKGCPSTRKSVLCYGNGAGKGPGGKSPLGDNHRARLRILPGSLLQAALPTLQRGAEYMPTFVMCPKETNRDGRCICSGVLETPNG
ncbi:unnamed protein product [Effrenium voratum]|nr:unnamed protein product [Effrenium voratum]